MSERATDRSPAGLASTYERRDERIDRTIGFRPVDPATDFELLFAWFGYDHLKPYWQLDRPREAARSLVEEKRTHPSLTPYLGTLDHVPMSYWEVYDAVDDEVASVYDAQPTDRGVHLFIGPPEYLGRGYATPLLRSLARFQFERPDVDRLVSEPDVRNDRAIRVFEACGFEPQREVALPNKEALLMTCTRDSFESLFDRDSTEP